MDGPDFVTGAYFFISTLVSIFAAYYAMKFAMYRREEREKFEKRKAAEEKRDVRTRGTSNGA